MFLSLQQFILKLIRAYQVSLSPDHGWFKSHYSHGFCRFYPSCSEYAYESVAKYGMGRGSWLALQRLLKCNPYHSGGIDLVR